MSEELTNYLYARSLIDLANVPSSRAINGHPLTTDVVVSASDITTGTLPHAQLPVLVSGDIPNNGANTTGTASNITGILAVAHGGTGTATPGLSVTITTAKLTTTGANGSMTFTNGMLTAQTPAT